MKKSIDKCAGEGCICHEVRPIKLFEKVKIMAISLDHSPSIFPGAGIVSIDGQTYNPAIAMEVERQRQARLGMVR